MSRAVTWLQIAAFRRCGIVPIDIVKVECGDFWNLARKEVFCLSFQKDPRDAISEINLTWKGWEVSRSPGDVELVLLIRR